MKILLKKIALTLVFLIVVNTIPAFAETTIDDSSINALIYVSEQVVNNDENINNYSQVFNQLDNKVDPLLYPELLNEDLSNSIYYNNFDYYNEYVYDVNDKQKVILPTLYLFGKAVGSFVWKKALKSTVMKWVAGTVASAYLSEIAINGLPKVKVNNVVGYGNIEYGYEVKTIQILLQKNGYNVKADSYWGPSTCATIKEFQRKYKLTVDGYVGRQTYEALVEHAKG